MTIVAVALRYLLSWVRAKHELALENLALRHQIHVLQRPRRRPRLKGVDSVLWVVLKRAWAQWPTAVMIFRPETVIAWQRAGFRNVLALEIVASPGGI
jgi:putative transposase